MLQTDVEEEGTKGFRTAFLPSPRGERKAAVVAKGVE
jgi:hypothetical protein